jgi:histone acetyltransferase (RNA polymerase elongator complex component)
MNKHSNISIFIPHAGCPYDCIYCNQRIISGAAKVPAALDVAEDLTAAAALLKNPAHTEIAFFGGSFTCLPENYMTELLSVAANAVKKNKLAGIRISTRPDAITPEIVRKLTDYGVTAIELGAQSLDDRVLNVNRRGHTAADVVNAVRCIREHFFGELGLQMMTGMYGSTKETDFQTARAIAALTPDTVRIYPAVVIKGTAFDKLLQDGFYTPIGFDEMVVLVSDMVLLFEKAEIRVIRVGLHASETLEADRTGGFYHPAFGELVEGELFLRQIREKLTAPGNYRVYVNPKNISKATGQKRKNIIKFMENGYNITVKADETMSASRVVRVQKARMNDGNL